MVGDVLRCTKCGKGWPANRAVCPDDGAPLGTLTGTQIARALAKTMVATPPQQDGGDFDTVIELGRGLASSDGGSFDQFGSDVLTHATERKTAPIDRKYVARRPASDEPATRARGPQSSDQPLERTVHVRRTVAHIELPPGSVVDELYEIEHRLGAGAMGEVYAARYLKLPKRVAIKVISPRLSQDAAAVERFAQEARTLAQMKHPGLVDVLGFGALADGRAYFVMEYLSGESLFDRLDRGRLERDAALDIFAQMARALEAAHTHGVIHRDLKPENTFLARVTNDPRPTVRLLDFGLAKLEIEVDRRAERTQSGVVLGTAMYLSPEQARGPDVDGRTDIYALGCIGYELFLGRHPFAGATTVVGIIAAHLHDVPPMPRSIDPSIPPELDGLLFALLAKDPAHRPTLPQLRAVVENLRARMGAAPVRTLPVRAVRAQTVPVAPISPSAPASTPTRPRSIERTTIVGALVVMLVGIIIGAVARRSGAGSDRPAAATTPVVVDAGARSVLTVDPIVLRAETPISDARPIDSAASPPVDAEPTHQRLAPDAREESVRNAVVTAPSGADTKQAEPTVAPNAAGSNSAAIDARPPTTDAPVLLPRESEPTKIDTAVSPPAPAPPKPPTKMKPSASDRDQIFNPFKKK